MHTVNYHVCIQLTQFILTFLDLHKNFLQNQLFFPNAVPNSGFRLELLLQFCMIEVYYSWLKLFCASAMIFSIWSLFGQCLATQKKRRLRDGLAKT